ncbi:LiaF transmembrane domain-containing protein [Cellvibrio mixtus]|uniref:LiaF transmembrane domain-containing protein n=1 Tax=Cellvibrio mixtus TaxID=39650 RepID=UPI0005873197|nr:hypothetical protein [Cellvibrio mixtus]
MSSIDEKSKIEAPVPGKPVAKVSPSSWALGLAVALIGGLLLAKNLGMDLFFLDFHNWWAFFILLAAIGPLQLAYRCYCREGVGVAMLNALVTAASIIFIALIFLLDLSFGTWWPAFIIIGGLYMMTSRNN